MNETLKLGIDIGRVIIGPAGADGRGDTAFLTGSEECAMATPAMPNAFECIAALVEVFEGRVWLVSKAGQRIEGRSRRWLDAHGFFAATGVPRANLRFCLERHEKAFHCRDLGITDFIDDRIQVLEHLRPVTPRLYLFGPQRSGVDELRWLTPVWDWRQTRTAVLERLPRRMK